MQILKSFNLGEKFEIIIAVILQHVGRRKVQRETVSLRAEKPASFFWNTPVTRQKKKKKLIDIENPFETRTWHRNFSNMNCFVMDIPWEDSVFRLWENPTYHLDYT